MALYINLLIETARSTNYFVDVVQLVEYDLAKVEVTGSSPVIHSIWPDGVIGSATDL